MLVTPILSLTLYTVLLLYGFDEYRQNNRQIEKVSENYLTLLEISGENARLIKDIVVQFKDAVLAGELDWVLSTNTVKEQVNANFEHLSRFPEVVDQEVLRQLQNDFNYYYTNALTLSLALLKSDKEFSVHETLIQDVEHYSNRTATQVTLLSEGIKIRFNQVIDKSNASLNSLLFWGSSIAVILLLLMVAVTIALSINTKKNFQMVIDRMRALAEDRPDFSRRLEHKKKDELGYLIHWFNKLSDTLEQNYIKVEKISITDKLTQLSNRTHTDEYMQNQLQKTRSIKGELIVIIVDIDHFKSVNDSHGHLVGDHVLREFSNLLRECIRNQDFVGRWGGEEFIIVMPDIDLEQATKNAERLRSMIEKHDFGEAGQITASFGISVSIDNDTQESLVQRADESLYKAKQQGRNQIVVETSDGSDVSYKTVQSIGSK